SVALGGTAVGAFADRNVGAGKAVTVTGFSPTGADAGNYVFTAPTGFAASITPATLTAGLTGTVTRVYDATTGAALAPGNYTLAGVIGGDAVTLNPPATGTFADKNVGTGKTVTVAGLALSGGDAGNYRLADATASAGIGTITAAPLTVTGVTVADKTYDGTTVASIDTAGATLGGLFRGDDVALSGGSGAFADRQAGIGKTVALSGFGISGGD